MRTLHKPLLLLTPALLAFLFSGAQETTAPVPAAGADFTFDANTVLAILAIFLFFIIAVLGYTLRSAIELYNEKKKHDANNGGKIITMVVAFLLFGTLQVTAQETATAAAAPVNDMFSQANLLRYLLLFIVALEFIAILVLVKWIRFFTGIEAMQEKASGKKAGLFGFNFDKIWQRMNKLKPIEQEASLDVGHSYDGIRELDNATPPWFTIAFIASILFGIFYLYRYHVAYAAPNQYQEYENSLVEAKRKVDEYMKAQGPGVDENTVTMQAADGIAAGAKLYTANCAVCHGDKGQGGVGPNFADNAWLHGCSIKDVFKTIKYGVVDKGMKSWKDDFSGQQIADLASYIETLKGTNPPGAKAPQGTPCVDGGGASAGAADSTAAKTDSTTATKTDSAATKP